MDNAIEKEVLKSITDTVGYHEAEKKGVFMDGAKVGMHKAADVYEPKIAALQKSLDCQNKRVIELSTDIKTLVNIVEKYSSNP